jgi:CheY-like chemotaxis protein
MLPQVTNLLPLLSAGGLGLFLGAGFCALWLRRVRSASPTPSQHAAAAPARPQVADLLLVDDSAVARAKLRALFEKAGYAVRTACDGVEALAELEKGRFALMVTDLEMPRMDGAALIDSCRNRPLTARMPILAITGHENLRVKFNQCGNISGVHRKPWVDDILLSHVATLVDVRGARVSAPVRAAIARAARDTHPAPLDARRPKAHETSS